MFGQIKYMLGIDFIWINKDISAKVYIKRYNIMIGHYLAVPAQHYIMTHVNSKFTVPHTAPLRNLLNPWSLIFSSLGNKFYKYC